MCNIYYYSIDDEAINVANLFIGNFYTLNQIKDLKKCPKCGSRATEQKKVYFWIDKKEIVLMWRINMAYCSKCGKLMEDDATFCSSCGLHYRIKIYI